MTVRTLGRAWRLASFFGVSLLGCSVLTSVDGLSGGTSAEDAMGDGGASGQGGSARDGAVLPDATFASTSADAGGADASQGGDASGVLREAGAADTAVDPCAACPSSCGTTISQSLATAPADWVFNGTAQYNSYAPSAELTAPVGTFQAGSFVYSKSFAFDAVTVQFQFRIGLQGGTRGDGMGFMLESNGPTAVGNSGGGLGLAGLTGYGAELDLYNNGVCGDSSNDQIGVDDLALCNNVDQTPRSLFATDATGIVDIGDTHWHTAVVSIASGAMSVTIDAHSFATSVPLPGFSATTPYYLGFAAATGGLMLPDGGTGGCRQEVKDVVITFPTARCL